MSSVLKGNDSLRFGVVTGVMQIDKSSIFSGLNNLTVNSILSRDMDVRFRFTPDEVEGICRDYGHPEKYPEAREWYDGYRFGDAEIYNLWSILNYVSNGFIPGAYWAGTSGNSVVDDLLSFPDRKTHDDLMVLGRGGSVEATIDPGQTFTDISSGTPGVYEVLAMSGYLRAVPSGGGYSLSIPNREMYGVFGDAVVSRLGGGTGMVPALRSLSKALLSGDEDETGRCIGDLLKDAVSFRILDDEHSYLTFLAGLLMNLYGCYSVTADHESGEGHHDIRLERIRGRAQHHHRAEEGETRRGPPPTDGGRPGTDNRSRLRPRPERQDHPVRDSVRVEDTHRGVEDNRLIGRRRIPNPVATSSRIIDSDSRPLVSEIRDSRCYDGILEWVVGK